MDKAAGSVEALIGDAGNEIGTALAAIGVATSIIAGLVNDERVDVTAEGWGRAGQLLRELPDLRKLHELRRLCAMLSGDYVPGGPVTGRDVLLASMGTGNVNDDDEESLQFADESEWMDDEDED